MGNGEVPLTGGRVTIGVVRIGDTVHRPAPRDPARARALLVHLAREGFEGVPRFLGTDGRDRDMLTFLDGDVPAELAHFEDEQLAAAARLLRRFHDATQSLARRWQRGAEVVCHNDWGPTNTVFRHGQPWGMIDFDTVAPGRRLWDIGYSAFLWLDLGNADYPGEEQRRRIDLFARAYDRADCPPAAIMSFALARQLALARRGRAEGDPELAQWAADAAAWTARHLPGRP